MRDHTVTAPITSTDRTGVDRIIAPPVAYQPAQVHPSQAQIDAHEDNQRRWEAQAHRNLDGTMPDDVDGDGDFGAPDEGASQPSTTAGHNAVAAQPHPVGDLSDQVAPDGSTEPATPETPDGGQKTPDADWKA